ncbi:hypothetical protein NY2A_b376L [Paramecium bursaria Chlorella virus NY2A]|uniref:Uncharacterized protein b376L n=1 Tax=Paramecium bursaria Chlorella virus NY2A TaxID=46021 RepID=A7IWQ1_PBCVN|nr:hypothetical protein NY2A_b376L [Paramecium bursaria Chlorella virus NY2A]ABT14775.1 hypothetical protein NY2A_b376L [Paramecium bursaria Chlorella virus NY2A]
MLVRYIRYQQMRHRTIARSDIIIRRGLDRRIRRKNSRMDPKMENTTSILSILPLDSVDEHIQNELHDNRFFFRLTAMRYRKHMDRNTIR